MFTTPPRALVADRMRTNRTILQAALAEEGYATVQVEDGQAALDALESVHFDLVVLENRLPDTGGLDVLKALHMIQRHRGSDEGLPPAILTVGDENEASAIARPTGTPEFVTLTKPLRGDNVRQALRSALARTA
jgi:CheY-like chemotaxis protein